MADSMTNRVEPPSSLKLEWLFRIQQKMQHRVDILGAHEAIVLLKQIEKLL